jgi:hypothetical protein
MLTSFPGIAYQLTENDPLADTAQCKRDSALMKTLGANSIRVYHVVADLNHDGCMSAFSDAGIYAWVDLDTAGTYILPNGGEPRWTNRQYQAYQRVMDTFQKYDNLAGFFVGNEMLTMGNDSVAAPFIKAAARDMKAYRDSKGYRNIPVGYSAADITSLRPNLQNYLACGSNSSETVDFYSLNVSMDIMALCSLANPSFQAYEWCGDSSYDVSGYDMLQKNASSYDIPIFLSETGCIHPEPRTFDDQSAILGPEMDGTWSGAIVYEWIQEANGYGLISYGPEVAATATQNNVVGGFTRAGTPTPISPDFENLSSQWATLTPSGVSENNYSPTLTPPACPSFTSGMWEVRGNVPLPTIGAKGTKYTTGITTGAAAASSTSSAGASSATRTATVSLRKRNRNSFWEGLWRFSKDHQVVWWTMMTIICVGGIVLVV